MRRQHSEAERAQLVELVRSTGMTIAAAADRLGVHRTTASNWVRRARPAEAKPTATAVTLAPRFARLVEARTASAAIEVQVGGAAIFVQAGFDAALLQAVVEALRGGAR